MLCISLRVIRTCHILACLHDIWGHLNLDDSHKSAIKNRLRSCRPCCNVVCNVTSFEILRKCNTDYDTKIYEALLIKKTKATSNKQIYGKGASFLLKSVLSILT